MAGLRVYRCTVGLCGRGRWGAGAVFEASLPPPTHWLVVALPGVTSLGYQPSGSGTEGDSTGVQDTRVPSRCPLAGAIG